MKKLPNEYGPYSLRKRFRHDDEYFRLRLKQPWRKNVLNLDEGTICLRTPGGWLIVTIYLLVFYAFIAMLWSLQYMIFKTTLSSNHPTVLLKQPGFCFAPLVQTVANYRIEYHENIYEEIEPYTNAITEMINKFGSLEEAKNEFDDCTAENDFGYRSRKPCIFLKMNRIIGYTPQPYMHVEELPQIAPVELRKRIIAGRYEALQNAVHVTCHSDMEKAGLKFQYSRSDFHTEDIEMEKTFIANASNQDEVRKFYGSKDFDRMMSVQLLNIPLDVNVIVECYLWAKNIEINPKKGRGYVRFEIKIKKDPHQISS